MPEHKVQIDPSPTHLLDVLCTIILRKDCEITPAGKKLPSLGKLMIVVNVVKRFKTTRKNNAEAGPEGHSIQNPNDENKP